MPTLPAAGYATRSAPSETSPLAVPDAYQRIQASPNAFGAAEGRALAGLGGELEQATNRLAATAIAEQELHNQVAADEQTNYFEGEVNKIMYGDPDKPGDVGYMGLQGRAALDARAGVRKQVDDLIAERRTTLQNDRQRITFDSATRRYRNFTLGQVGQHYDAEFKRHTAQTYDARADIQRSNASIAANQGNFGAFQDFLGKGLVSLKQGGEAAGLPAEVIEVKQREFTKHTAEAWARSALERNPVEALKFIDDNKEHLGERFDELHRAAATKALDAQALSIVTGQPLNTGVTNKIGVEGTLDLIREKESGGRNIEQQLVPPQGGFNPSVGRVTGPSTASGEYQITDSTWRQFAPEAGVNIAQYSRAIQAPPDIQRQVARTILTSPNGGGIHHWANYNKQLRMALKVSDTLVAQTFEPGDEQVPGLTQKLQEVEARLPPDASPELKLRALKLTRQLHNMAFVDQQQQERARRQAQQQNDEKVSNEFITRMAPGSANPPSSGEIMTHPELTTQAKEGLTRFLLSTSLPGPPPRVAADNQAKLFGRIHLPDGDPEKIVNESQINDAFSRDRTITYEMNRQLVNDFREAQGAATAAIAKQKAETIKALEPRIRPFASNPLVEAASDADGPQRELSFRRFIDSQVDEYRKAGKNPASLFDPDSKDFVGAPEKIKRFRGNALADMLKQSQSGDIDTSSIAALQAAVKAGKLTAQRAREIALEKGLVRKEIEVPIR